MRSIEDALAENGGVGPGFDLLRFGLATIILFGHTRWIANGDVIAGAVAPTPAGRFPLFYDWMYPRHVALVPMFFALSGFLVTASAVRTGNVAMFLLHRGLRILPALVVEVTLSAILLGPYLTTWNIHEYFADPRFVQYFGNIVGRIRFTLPGLFDDSPASSWVNVNLWTLTAEFYCYVVAAAVILTGLLFRRKHLVAIFVVVTVCLIAFNSYFGFELRQSPNPSSPYNIVLIYYFLVGTMIFLWRDRIPLSFSLFLVSVLASYVFILCSKTIFIAPIFVAYGTVFLGMSNLPKMPLLSTGDYSYGIYLYGFPLTQALITVHPAFRGHSWELLFWSILVTLIFAALSWHLIEKRFLGLRSLIRKKGALAT